MGDGSGQWNNGLRMVMTGAGGGERPLQVAPIELLAEIAAAWALADAADVDSPTDDRSATALVAAAGRTDEPPGCRDYRRP